MYNGEIVAGSLLINETIQVARLALKGLSDDEVEQAIFANNLLQKRSRATIRRQLTLIQKRVGLIPRPVLELVVENDREAAVQAILVGAIKHSRLLGDFMRSVLKEKIRTFKKHCTKKDWARFLENCEQIDPLVKRWSESTKAKLGQVVFRILAEAKYVDNTRSLTIRPVLLSDEVRHLLAQNRETYVLECMDYNL